MLDEENRKKAAAEIVETLQRQNVSPENISEIKSKLEDIRF